MIEVLAPAGNPESFEAAVKSGADAIYFGAGNFNARRNAKNFTPEDVRRCVAFARERGVKTYLTLNTLTADSELSAALDTALLAAEAGVSALIVQDLGLIRLLRRHLPNMPLHASTQMSVHSPEALAPLKEMGFSRVVVAREMDRISLAAICDEAKRLNLEIEAFVHGALCMCLSGQCYLSSVLGGRSGNRGLCAQPCRLPFSVNGGTGHDLSLKDMSYIPHIGEMAEMGVTSFKIEGRMKRPEYVAAAVTAVRHAAEGNAVPPEVAELLSGLFSRSGHTDGYYKNALGQNMFGIRTEADEKMSQRSVNSAHELYRREFGRVKLSAFVEIRRNRPLLLTVSDLDGNSVTVNGEVPEEAKSREVVLEAIAQKLKKCGGTPYIMESVSGELDSGLSVSAAALSALRQSALDKLSAIRYTYDGKALENNTVADFVLPVAVPDKTKALTAVAFFRNVNQIPENLFGIKAVILPVESDFSKVKLPEGIDLLADIPRGILHTADKVKAQLFDAKQNGVKAAVCGNLAAIELAKQVDIPAIAGFGLNLYNTCSVEQAADLKLSAAVLSFEMSLSDALRCGGDIPKGIISYGKLPLMLTRNCPNKNGSGCKSCNGHSVITDRKGIEFALMCRGEFTEMFNSRPVWLFDRKTELLGLDFEVLMFTDETRDRCAEILAAHQKGLPADVEFTRGLYYREVL